MNSSPSDTSAPKGGTSDLFDQTALTDLAQRLVEAAKRAGADAADAVAVRGEGTSAPHLSRRQLEGTAWFRARVVEVMGC